MSNIKELEQFFNGWSFVEVFAAAGNLFGDEVNWCKDIVGEQGVGWTTDWCARSDVSSRGKPTHIFHWFIFRKRADALMFMLKYGGKLLHTEYDNRLTGT